MEKVAQSGSVTRRFALGGHPVRPGPGRPPRSTNFHLLSILPQVGGNCVSCLRRAWWAAAKTHEPFGWAHGEACGRVSSYSRFINRSLLCFRANP